MKKAFTLIELLVVIAIIAILAAILFPVFAQAKLAAKKTVALSNAKNLGMALQIYQGDYDDHLIKSYFGFPQTDCANLDAHSWDGPFYNWRTALAPYDKSNDILRDITNPFSAANFDTAPGTAGVDLPHSTNFAVNSALIGFAAAGTDTPNCQSGLPAGLSTLDSISDVASTIEIAPNRSSYNDLRFFFMGYGSTINSWGGPATVAGDPAVCHGSTCVASGNGPIHAIAKKASFVWADGHAKAKDVAATLRISDSTGSDWGDQYELASGTGHPGNFTQADRQIVQSNLFPEYK